MNFMVVPVNARVTPLWNDFLLCGVCAGGMLVLNIVQCAETGGCLKKEAETRRL